MVLLMGWKKFKYLKGITMKASRIWFAIILIYGLLNPIHLSAQAKWYQSYDMGQQSMKAGNWKQAADYFKAALQVKAEDKSKTRSSGAMFIEYFPHRELGICYYFLGQLDLAKYELRLSLQQAFSRRASIYLQRVERGLPPAQIDEIETVPTPAPSQTLTTPATLPPATVPTPSSSVTQVGERLRIAILPLENKGQNAGIDLLDKLITVFVNLDRFKVLERAQLEKVLEEQKLGMTGVLDAATAAKIGKGIGVDAVVSGSVSWMASGASIDARFIDTETASILTAQDGYSQGSDLRSLNAMLEQLANKIKNDLPIVNGYVIGTEGDKLTLDLGRNQGVRKGMKCFVFREGAPIVHPVTKQVLGKSIEVLCEIQLIDVYPAYSIGYIIGDKNGIPKASDQIITR
jgi:TolB-like protein